MNKNFRRLISLLMAFAMCIGMTTVMAVESTYQITVSADKTEYLDGEIICVTVTNPAYKNTYTKSNGDSFKCMGFRVAVDDVLGGRNQGTPVKIYYKTGELGVGNHTIKAYAGGENATAIDEENFAEISISVLDSNVENVYSENFEGSNITNVGDVIADSNNVITNVKSGRTESETDYNDSFIQLKATDNETYGNALYNYQANASSNTASSYKKGNFGEMEYAINEMPNKGVIKLDMDYYFPGEYNSGATRLTCVPFALVDNEGKELYVERINRTSNTKIHYAVNGLSFLNNSFMSDADNYLGLYIAGTSKNTAECDIWQNISVMYDCDTGIVSLTTDNENYAVSKVEKLPGTSITKIKYYSSYSQNATSGIAIDNINVSHYTKAAEEPDPEPVSEFVLSNSQIAIADGVATLNVDVKNTTNDTKNVKGIIAMYNNGVLVKLTVEDVAFEGLSEQKTVSAAQITMGDTEYTNIKGYIWDGFSAIKPLIGAAEVTSEL